ncbi:MAG: hypothetical protein LBN05_07070 [Oscillospiraceae bacterium]|jgi:hypothetical protein|nr:hypothetical protein [Oscillospiraceae bacterium]
MKKFLCLLLAGLLCALGVACGAAAVVPTEPTEWTEVTISDTESEPTTPAPTTVRVTGKYDNIKSKLADLLRAKIDGGNILAFDELDYDGDGVTEAFAFVGHPDGDSGELWFVGRRGAEKIDDDNSWQQNEVLTFGTHSFLMMRSGSYAHWGYPMWGVKNGQAFSLNFPEGGGYFDKVDNKNLNIIHSTWDVLYDVKTKEGAGHTWKPYYLYWDTSSASFKEYGGIPLTVEQLRKAKGADAILAQMEERGEVVGDIYYRANGIINVNFHEPGKGKLSRSHVTLRLKGNTVTVVHFAEDAPRIWQEGIYFAALLPDIATYPKALPAVFR